jgi:hypothetical protein
MLLLLMLMLTLTLLMGLLLLLLLFLLLFLHFFLHLFLLLLLLLLMIIFRLVDFVVMIGNIMMIRIYVITVMHMICAPAISFMYFRLFTMVVPPISAVSSSPDIAFSSVSWPVVIDVTLHGRFYQHMNCVG